MELWSGGDDDDGPKEVLKVVLSHKEQQSLKNNEGRCDRLKIMIVAAFTRSCISTVVYRLTEAMWLVRF